MKEGKEVKIKEKGKTKEEKRYEATGERHMKRKRRKKKGRTEQMTR